MKTLPPRVMVRAASMEYYLDRFNPDGTRRAGPVAPFWWRSEGVERQWCGVFQGGGVKGVAYAGPLSFFAQRRQWFGEVTGSSVGALTATLIASGLHPDELFRATIDLLEQIQPATPLDRLIAALPPSRWFARYESAGLEQALERKLGDAVRRHGVEPAGRVTFSELEAATGIRLTIVVLDTATGHPLPFCPQWSPELSVSTAAVASCSVPVVFPSRFLEVDPLTPGPEWRRLADGGVFANFPSFVYEDPAFRRYYRLGPMPESSKTIGFVFSDPREVTPPVPRRFVTDPRHVLPSGDVISGTSRYHITRRERMETKAAILDALNVAGYINDERRAALEPKDIPAALAAIPVTIYGILTLLIQVVPLAGIGYLAWTGGAAGVALAVLLLLVFVLVRRFGILVRREGISVLRTWSGLALRPPVWVGAVPDSFVVFVRAPGLSTVSFSARRTTVVEAVWVARVLSAPEILAIVDQRTTVLHETARAYTRRAEHEDVRRAIAEHDQRVRRRLPSHPFDRSWWTRLRDFLFG